MPAPLTESPRSEDDRVALQRELRRAGVEARGLSVLASGPSGTSWRFDVDGMAAIDTWERLRPRTAALGYYPIVCRDPHGTLAELPDLNGDDVAGDLSASESIDTSDWYSEREASDEEYYGEVDLGEWSDTTPQSGWSVPLDDGGASPADGVFVALVPTTRSWEVLAYLRYGDWNECPSAAEHTALHRDWHERFGAEVVCVSGDVVEMRVRRPPRDRDAASALAREQFVYSGGDLVFQGYESLRALASALIDAEYWYFWWD